MTFNDTAISALKFLGPHLLSILTEAVKRWNDRVPEELEESYRKDLALIESKLTGLPCYEDALADTLYAAHAADPDPKVFADILISVVTYLDERFLEIAKLYTRSFVNSDVAYTLRAIEKIHKLCGKFQLSQEVSEMTGLKLETGKKEVQIVDDALLALARSYPTRMIAASGTLIIRDLVAVNHMSVPEREISDMKVKFDSLYHMRIEAGYFRSSSVRLIPKYNFVPEEAMLSIYGVSFKDLSFHDLAKLINSEQPWYIREDPNISVDAIMGKIIGSCITSLSTVIADAIVWFSQIMVSDGNSAKDSMLHVRTKPWTQMEDMMQFSSPIVAYHHLISKGVSSHRCEHDFDTVYKMLSLYRIYLQSHSQLKFSHPEPVTITSDGSIYPKMTPSIYKAPNNFYDPEYMMSEEMAGAMVGRLAEIDNFGGYKFIRDIISKLDRSGFIANDSVLQKLKIKFNESYPDKPDFSLQTTVPYQSTSSRQGQF
jgi:hypothetical protein